MKKIALKSKFKQMVIAFNGSAEPLGKRNDLHHLIKIAHEAERKDYLAMFENPPSLDDINAFIDEKGKDAELETEFVSGKEEKIAMPAYEMQPDTSGPENPAKTFLKSEATPANEGGASSAATTAATSSPAASEASAAPSASTGTTASSSGSKSK